MLLADILTERGEHEQNAIDYELAARHLFAVQQNLPTDCHPADVLDLRFALADALGQLGRLIDDPNMLDVAIRLYHNGFEIAVANEFDIE